MTSAAKPLRIRFVTALLLVTLLAVGGAACTSDDTQDAGWAIVKVEILSGPPLASICIDSMCRDFDQDDAFQTGEFSAFVQAGTRFEVLQLGAGMGEGASGPSPVGGCVLLELDTETASFIGGCNAPPPES